MGTNQLGDNIKASLDSLSEADKNNRTKVMQAMGNPIEDWVDDRGIIKLGTTITDSNDVTIALPDVTTEYASRLYWRKGTGTGKVLFSTTSSQLMNGLSASHWSLENEDVILLEPSSTEWKVLLYGGYDQSGNLILKPASGGSVVVDDKLIIENATDQFLHEEDGKLVIGDSSDTTWTFQNESVHIVAGLDIIQTVDNLRYGYVSFRRQDGKRGGYIGWGNGDDRLNLELENATYLSIKGHLLINSNDDVSPSTAKGGALLQIGNSDEGLANIVIDGNEIIARQGTATSSDNVGLGLQTEGGGVTIGYHHTEDRDSGLYIGSKKDAYIILEADTDNVTETDNPYIKFIQDNGGIYAYIGLMDDTSSKDNVFYLSINGNYVYYTKYNEEFIRFVKTPAPYSNASKNLGSPSEKWHYGYINLIRFYRYSSCPSGLLSYSVGSSVKDACSTATDINDFFTAYTDGTGRRDY